MDDTIEKQNLDIIVETLMKTARDIREYIAEPLAPDAEVQAWPLYAGDEGIWCGDDECPLQAESSEIGDFRDGVFTLKQLHEAIAEHIAIRRARESEI